MTAAIIAASYRPAVMTMTPWGPAEDLRSRRLPPGPSGSRAAVVENQRERLMAAMVAVVAERGYETTRVADVLELAGVSRSAYYQHFSNKDECFLATLDALLEMVDPIVAGTYRSTDGSWDERLGAVFEAVVKLIVAQPAAARIWFVETYAAGPEAVERVERLGARVEQLTAKAMGESPDRAGMPKHVVRAILGGLRHVVHTRLRHGREDELIELAPDLVDWALGYHAPSRPLRRPRKVPSLALAAPDPDASGQRERILAAVTEAVAEKSYQSLTITEIARRASVSLTTFYDLFESKPVVFLAALADGERRLADSVLPYYSRAGDWPHAVRDGTHAIFAFLAGNAALAKLGTIDVYAGGDAARTRQEKTQDNFRALLYPGFQAYPDTAEIAGEAVGSAVYALVFQQLRSAGPSRLYEVAPTAVYLALAPFVGPDEAIAIANEDWQAS